MAERTQPVRVVLRMDVVQGREAEFERVWLEIARLIAARPANRGQQLVRATEEAGRPVDGGPVYYVFTDWDDEASFREFELSAEHVEHRRRLAPLRTGGSMTVASVVHRLPGAEPARG
ncbi:antibiotic biosynthesis monooxygenase family protein [Kitasatospora sp. NPDC089797]|uniref:antibiotic biosynthesis monooxygenase family protein n=1 Tax=Kitasatospora sp. NPDC089797 TaxID=3155298 RepID=UPI00341D933C